MPQEKKARVDVDKLGSFIGKYLYINGIVLMIFGVLLNLDIQSLTFPVIIFFVISTIFVLVKAQKYDGNVYDENGKLRKGQGKKLVLALSIITIVLVFITALLIYSSQATEVAITQDGLTIQGMYGINTEWSDIQDVQLINELPTIEKRTNGSSFNSHLKGHFKTTEHGAVLLFLTTKGPTFIYLKTDDQIIYVNSTTKDDTLTLYEEIQTKTHLGENHPK